MRKHSAKSQDSGLNPILAPLERLGNDPANVEVSTAVNEVKSRIEHASSTGSDSVALWNEAVRLLKSRGIEGADAVAACLVSGEPRAKQERVTQGQMLLEIAEHHSLWHTADGTAYASVPTPRGLEHHPVRSSEYQRLVKRAYYKEHGRVIAATALADGLEILEGKALYDSEERDVFVRVGTVDDVHHLDLADGTGQAIEITGDGWTLTEPPIAFWRSNQTAALPTPERGGSLDLLSDLFGLTREQSVLVGSWLLGALRGRSPYPILMIDGEQGSGKSTLTRMLRALVDPRDGGLRQMPMKDEDLYIAAKRSWIYAIDNTSGIPKVISDTLCCVSTGAARSVRKHYTNDEEVVIQLARPVILNGIDLGGAREDLLSRTVCLRLRSISPDQRRDETTLWSMFEEHRPRILGALLDGVSTAIRNLPDVRLQQLPRMADYARWITGGSESFGWMPDEPVDVFVRSNLDVQEETARLNPVVEAFLWVGRNLDFGHGMQMTASDWLAYIRRQAPDAIADDADFPRSARRFSGALKRAEPVLYSLGVAVTRHRSADASRDRLIRVSRIKDEV